MQELPGRRPLPLPRSHLDSDTYRAVLRILSHCVELEPRVPSSPPRLSPSLPGPREQDRSASFEGAANSCGIPGEDGCGLGEARGGDARERHGEGAGRGSPEDGGHGLEKVPDVLVDGCPRLADANVADSPLVEGLGPREVREEVNGGSRNVVSHIEGPCGSPFSFDCLDDVSVDFSSLMEELDLQKVGVGTDLPDEDGFKNKLSLEDGGLLGFSETCPRVSAPEDGEKAQGRTMVDDSFGNGDELPTELVCKDPEPLPVPSGNPRSMEASCMETQLESCDSSIPSRNGSGTGELGDHQKITSICTVEEGEMEEGEIPNEGETSDFSFGLEFQDPAEEGIQLEESHPVDDSAEKGNVTHVMGGFVAKGASSDGELFKEKVKCAVLESDRLIGRVEPKPQKKKKSAKETKNYSEKIRKNVDLSSQQSNDEMELECQKKMKNAANTKDAISENIASWRLSLTEVSLKDVNIQCEEKASNTEDVKIQQKRKRAPLTENRKEKKKLAKKRKRAETNKKLGVKRLKLEMVSKPKKVIPCSFYQKGRCQKGDSCKFSHDMIPDTKSMPCTFFARGTCLKGDDCPFDHQLSKYPCHSYMSHGRCNRGDSCLFLHKIPMGELSSKTSVPSETDSTMVSEKQSLQKCLNSANFSSTAVSTSLKTTTTSAKSSMPKDSVEQMKLKQPMKVPKGISFLSFGKAPYIDINKQHHDLDLKKGDNIQIQKQEERIISGKLQNSNENLLTSPEKSLSCRTLALLVNEDKSSSLLQKSPLLVQQNVEIKSCESIQPPGSITTSNGSKDFTTIESKLTDASRILEEFLFSGIS